MRDPNYLKFLREEGKCSACIGAFYREHRLLTTEGVRAAIDVSLTPCDPAHGPVNGKGSKGPDSEAVPLCRVHHEEQHSLTWPAFESKYGFSRATEAKVWWTAFQIWKEHEA